MTGKTSGVAALKASSDKGTAKPPHPGSHVKHAINGLGLSLNAFARKLKVFPATIHRIVTEKVALSPEMASGCRQLSVIPHSSGCSAKPLMTSIMPASGSI